MILRVVTCPACLKKTVEIDGCAIHCRSVWHLGVCGVHITGKLGILLFLLLCRHKKIVSLDEMLVALYGWGDGPEHPDKCVDAFIMQLRKRGFKINTHWGQGWELV